MSERYGGTLDGRLEWLTGAPLAPEFARDVREGLLSRPKRLPCRYFYDAEGSLLFEEICALPEYYLTRTERAILERCAPVLAESLPRAIDLVELGSGSASKTRLVIEALLARRSSLRYLPIDISPSILEASSQALLRDYPRLRIVAIAAEYRDGLRRLAERTDRPKLILWLGSNVGNLDRPEAAAFLRAVRATMRPDDRFLIGIDLRKDRSVLEPAYDDARGVTARFNRNLLARINRELGGEFRLETFRHVARYDEAAGRIEMYLESAEAQRVRIAALGLEVPFAAGERIHTENSYKYSPDEIEWLCAASGMRREREWQDPLGYYSVSLLAPEGGASE